VRGRPSIESFLGADSSERAQHENRARKGVERVDKEGIWAIEPWPLYTFVTKSVTCDAFVIIVGDGADSRKDWVIVGCLPTTTHPPSTTSIPCSRSVGDSLTARHVR
jgi:hypothetical protein